MFEKNNYKIMVRLADDYYSATLDIRYKTAVPSEKVLPIDLEEVYQDVLSELKHMNVFFGIDHQVIKESIASETDCLELIIARGVRHKNAVDAYITYHVNFEGTSKTIIKSDGTVDFKNLLQVSAVRTLDILATKTPIVAGHDGVTVTGKDIKHKPGKDITFKFGENVALSDDGLTLVAETDGIAKLINNRVTVLKLMEVDAVGPETGNVYFGGDVHVKESVLSGYIIHCDGDLTIDGVVEGCTLKVKGNLTVGKGILGHGLSDIVVDGNLFTKFIENAQVYVKGTIDTGEIVNSTVLCDGKITVKGKKGLIIGGEITSKYMIEANRIGSRLGVLTSINLGVDLQVITELKQLKEVIQELKILETRLKAKIPALKQNSIHQPEVGIHEDLLHQYEKSLLATQVEIEEKENRLSQLMAALKSVRDGKVKINSIFPDTIITIGDSKYFVDKELSACIISRADDQVVAISTTKEL